MVRRGSGAFEPLMWVLNRATKNERWLRERWEPLQTNFCFKHAIMDKFKHILYKRLTVLDLPPIVGLIDKHAWFCLQLSIWAKEKHFLGHGVNPLVQNDRRFDPLYKQSFIGRAVQRAVKPLHQTVLRGSGALNHAANRAERVKYG